jgi:hypothetical protein
MWGGGGVHGRTIGEGGLLFELLVVTICEVEQKMGEEGLELT